MIDPVLCANCGIEILWAPVELDGHRYCCAGCAAGGPCSCSYDDRGRGEVTNGAADHSALARDWAPPHPFEEV